MKKKIIPQIIPLLLAFIIIYCLIYPVKMAQSISDGLTLWYRSILPTLLPFSIFSNIIVQSGVYDHVFDRMYPLFKKIYPVRSPLIYPLVAGFLFGFPLGSKICADLFQAGKITKKEAELISSVSNNYGPAFLYNYMIQNVFAGEIPAFFVFAACYLPPLLLGRIRLYLYYRKIPPKQSASVINKKTASRSQINIKIIDAGIMDGFTTMIKLAGYIILSALLADMLKGLPFQNEILKCVCIGAMEITNGVHQISMLTKEMLIKAMLAIGIVSFGGFSGLCQTYSMMKATGISIKNYLYFKLMCSLCGILLIAAFYWLVSGMGPF